MIRFLVWNSGGDAPGTVVIDPFAVAAVHETIGKSNNGRDESQVAVIHLNDGTQFTVADKFRSVAEDICKMRSVLS